MKKLLYSMMFVAAGVFAFVAMLFVGCGSTDQLGQGGNSGAGGVVIYKFDANPSGQGSSGGSGGSGTSGVPPSGDANCGSQTSSTSHEPADVLLVLDRSGSMSYSIAEDCYCTSSGGGTVCSNTSNCTTRWSTVSSALQTTLTSTPTIHWGLKLYSSPSGSGECDVSSGAEVPIGTNSASAIQTQMTNTTPARHTPTAAAITAATAYLKTVNDPSNKVILLATDGEPNCASNGRTVSADTTDVQGTVTAITAAKDAGFLVYVIGIGPSVGNLDNFANAGGTGNYYPATSPAELAAALAAISTAVGTCTFTLTTKPPDVNNLAVYVDGNLVKKDDPNGWSLGANSQTVLLNGSTCDKIKSGQATSVQVLFGCPGVPPPPTIPIP
jgi:hypothetical protein